MESESTSLLRKVWDFLKVRKIWWMTPLIIMIIIFILSVLAGESISIASIYAPV